MFSFGQTGNAYSASCSSSNPAPAGYFCKNYTTYKCRTGCFCLGGGPINVTADIRNFCDGTSTPNTNQLSKINKAGVFICGLTEGASGSYSPEGATDVSQCDVFRCDANISAGRYCSEETTMSENCPKGCWCDGGSNLKGVPKLNPLTGTDFALWSHCRNHDGHNNSYMKDYLEERGIHYCPLGTTTNGDGKGKSVADSSSDNDCGSKPGRGKYCYKKNDKRKCNAGCYCPGDIKIAVNPNSSTDAMFNVPDRCEDHDQNTKSYLEGRGVMYCPSDFPESDAGANGIKDCYKKLSNGQRSYYGQNGEVEANNGSENPKVTCDPGYYLPANTNLCKQCTDNTVGNYICPGGEFTKNSTDDQGLTPCEGRRVPNQNHTKCVIKVPTVASAEASSYSKPDWVTSVTPDDSTTVCDDGSYLLEDGTCATCPAGYMCPGDGYAYKCGPAGISSAGKSNCTPCSAGQMANNTNTACEDGIIIVGKGQYLPANMLKPESCSASGKFCPGGRWKKASLDQGAFDCPFEGLSGSVSGSNNESCTINLTKKQMAYGIDENKDCWKYTNNYKTCVWGDITFTDVSSTFDTGTEYNPDADVNNPSAGPQSGGQGATTNNVPTNNIPTQDDADSLKGDFDFNNGDKEGLKSGSGAWIQATTLKDVPSFGGAVAQTSTPARATRTPQPQRGVRRR